MHTLTHEMSVQKNKDFYDFENSDGLVDVNVRSKFKLGHFVVMKCAFSIENYQPGPIENDTSIINTW